MEIFREISIKTRWSSGFKYVGGAGGWMNKHVNFTVLWSCSSWKFNLIQLQQTSDIKLGQQIAKINFHNLQRIF